MEQTIFERQYQEKGIYAQRLYPNEALCCFMGENGLFSMDTDMRKEIKILELGSGSGGNLWMMAKEGYDVYGVDSSETSIRIANEHLGTKWGVSATIRQGTFDELPFNSNMFDYVVDVVSLFHIDLVTTRVALKEIERVMKKGGRFFSYRLSDRSCTFQNHGSKRIDIATVDDVMKGELPLSHNKMMSFWSPNLVYQEYESAGLTVTNIDFRNRTYHGGLYSIEYLDIRAEK